MRPHDAQQKSGDYFVLHLIDAISGNSQAGGCCARNLLRLSGHGADTSDKAKFGLNETSLGILPPLWLEGITART